MTKYDVVANVAFFLLDKTGSVNGKWKGKLSAKEQRSLFGCFMGKGTIYIDGENETIEHVKQVCFGTDFDTTFSSKLVDIQHKAENVYNIPYNAKAIKQYQAA